MNDVNFDVNKVYSSDLIYNSLGVNTTRGIKYTGTADNPNYIVVIVNLDSWSEDNPYHDRLNEDRLYCSGEGLSGKQEMIGGNLALSKHLITHCPIYVFRKLDINEYKDVKLEYEKDETKLLKVLKQKFGEEK